MKPVILALFAMSLILSACSSDGDDAPSNARMQLTLGVVQSLTGAGGVYGQSVVRGVEIAIEEINASPDSGLHVDYITVDDLSTPAGGNAAFRGLTEQDVAAIVGPTLAAVAFESLKLAQAASIPVVAPTTTALGITDTGEYIFSTALPEDVVVPATIAYVSRQVPLRNAVLVWDSTDAFSRGSADAMRKGLAAINAALIAEIDISKEADVAGVLAGLSRGIVPVDAYLVTPLVDQSAKIVTAIRAAGITAPIVGGNSFNTLDIARLTGSAIEAAYVGAAWNPGEPAARSRAFVDAFRRKYGTAPDQFAAQGYASVYILADAAGRASSIEPDALRDALAATQSLDTPLGRLSMGPNRVAVHTPVVQQYRGGRLVVVQ